jgi:aldose 1-epimerase
MPRSAPTCAPFGTTPDGRPVELWRLDSPAGVGAEVLTYGAILHALYVPDRTGRRTSVVLCLPDAAAYAAGTAYLGAVVGRYANRIAGGGFALDGTAYTLPVNDRGQTLHGGPDGFHRRLWRAEPQPDGALRLTLHSPDGDMGFPGALDVAVTYALDDEGTLSLDFEARTDRATVVNLTNHAYFNLAGAGGGSSRADRAASADEGGTQEGGVLRHVLRIDADRFLPVTAEAIPAGPALDVAGTPFDFTSPRALGDRVDDPDPQIAAARGYDHCWVLRPAADPAGTPRTAAVLHDPDSGRTMEVRTTEPGVQVYTANSLDGSLAGADGQRHGRHGAVCLETQHLPDSPNRPDFPSTVLRPGQVLRSRTEFRFPGAVDGGPAA